MTQGGLLHMSHPIFMDLNPICCYVSPKIVIFHEPLIVGTCNKCHWIQHASNLKYAPLKQFQCIVPSQNQQNVKFMPEIVIFLEPLIVGTCNKCHWIWHISNPTCVLLKPFQCICPSQNQQNVKFFVWNCNFLGTTYHRDSKPAVLDLACLKP